MAVCPNCGGQVSDDARFCASCGGTITPAAQPGAGAPPPPPSPPVSPQQLLAQPPAPPFGAPPAQGPGVVIPPPPVKQRTGSIWKLIIVIALIGVLVIGGVVATVVFLVVRAVKPTIDVTNQFIEAINEGNAEKAWSLISPSSTFKDNYTLTTFETEIVDALSGQLETWDAHEASISGSEAKVGVDFTYKDGTDDSTTFYLEKSGDEWLILDWD
jgi:uncharacterized membrane protein YvbJ